MIVIDGFITLSMAEGVNPIPVLFISQAPLRYTVPFNVTTS